MYTSTIVWNIFAVKIFLPLVQTMLVKNIRISELKFLYCVGDILYRNNYMPLAIYNPFQTCVTHIIEDVQYQLIWQLLVHYYSTKKEIKYFMHKSISKN